MGSSVSIKYKEKEKKVLTLDNLVSSFNNGTVAYDYMHYNILEILSCNNFYLVYKLYALQLEERQIKDLSSLLRYAANTDIKVIRWSSFYLWSYDFIDPFYLYDMKKITAEQLYYGYLEKVNKCYVLNKYDNLIEYNNDALEALKYVKNVALVIEKIEPPFFYSRQMCKALFKRHDFTKRYKILSKLNILSFKDDIFLNILTLKDNNVMIDYSLAGAMDHIKTLEEGKKIYKRIKEVLEPYLYDDIINLIVKNYIFS